VIVQPVSDLHSDCRGFAGYPKPAASVDVVLVAGDTRQGIAPALTELRRAYPSPIEIVVVAGNHEFWGGTWRREIEHARRAAAEMDGIHFLEDSVTFIGGLRVIGCTRWSDYDLFGPSLRASAMRWAYDTVRDHKRMKWQSNPWLRFRPTEARLLHLTSRAFIEAELSKSHQGPTAVITHFPATPHAINPRLQRSISTAAACSDLSPLIERYQPDLWVSGHTHYRMNSRIGRTCLISNPSGYAGETTGFDPNMTVELGK
jgi:Icc-related predicted phosphoesterase